MGWKPPPSDESAHSFHYFGFKCIMQFCDINVVVDTGNWVQFRQNWNLEWIIINMDCNLHRIRVFIWILFDPCSRVYSFVSRDISRWNCWTRGVAIWSMEGNWGSILHLRPGALGFLWMGIAV